MQGFCCSMFFLMAAFVLLTFLWGPGMRCSDLLFSTIYIVLLHGVQFILSALFWWFSHWHIFMEVWLALALLGFSSIKPLELTLGFVWCPLALGLWPSCIFPVQGTSRFSLRLHLFCPLPIQCLQWFYALFFPSRWSTCTSGFSRISLGCIYLVLSIGCFFWQSN